MTIPELITLQLILTSLVALAVHFAARFKDWESFDDQPEAWKAINHTPDGREILWWLRYYGSALPTFMQKPLYLCPICMCSFWGLLVAAGITALIGFVPEMIVVYLLGFTAAAGVNMLVVFNLKTE